MTGAANRKDPSSPCKHEAPMRIMMHHSTMDREGRQHFPSTRSPQLRPLECHTQALGIFVHGLVWHVPHWGTIVALFQDAFDLLHEVLARITPSHADVEDLCEEAQMDRIMTLNGEIEQDYMPRVEVVGQCPACLHKASDAVLEILPHCRRHAVQVLVAAQKRFHPDDEQRHGRHVSVLLHRLVQELHAHRVQGRSEVPHLCRLALKHGKLRATVPIGRSPELREPMRDGLVLGEGGMGNMSKHGTWVFMKA